MMLVSAEPIAEVNAKAELETTAVSQNFWYSIDQTTNDYDYNTR